MKSQKVIFGKFRTAFDEELFLVNIVKYENYFALKLIKKPLKKKNEISAVSLEKNLKLAQGFRTIRGNGRVRVMFMEARNFHRRWKWNVLPCLFLPIAVSTYPSLETKFFREIMIALPYLPLHHHHGLEPY